MYKVLLRNGARSSKEDIKSYLETLDLNQENYQIGETKVQHSINLSLTI